MAQAGVGAPTVDHSTYRLRVFVSYSRRDMEFADALVAALEKQNFKCTIDRRDLEYGEKWQGVLRDFIRQSDAVVFVTSAHSVASQWCGWELAEVAKLSKRLVSVAPQPIDPSTLPAAIGDVHLMPFYGDRSFDDLVDQLGRVLLNDREWLLEHTRLAELAFSWNARGRTRDRLLRGKALRDIETWMARRPSTAPQVSQEQLNFVSASQSASKRRSRAWTVGLGAATAAALSMAVWADLNRRIADKERLTSESVLEGGRSATTDMVVNTIQQLRKTSGVPPTTVQSLLTDMLRLIEKLQIAGGERLGLEQAKALANIELSGAYRSVGKFELALSTARSSVAILQRLSQQEKSASVLADLVVAYDRRGDAESAMSLVAPAASSYTASLTVASEMFADDRSSTSARLLATAIEKTAYNIFERQDAAVALDMHTTVLRLRRAISKEAPQSAVLKRELGVTLERLADLTRVDDAASANRYYKESIDLANQTVEAEPANLVFLRDLAVRYQKIGSLADAQEAGAQEYHRSNFNISMRISRLNPERADLYREAIDSAIRLAELPQTPEEAVQPLDEALALVRPSVEGGLRAELVRAIALCLSQKAKYLVTAKSAMSAVKAYEEAISLLEEFDPKIFNNSTNAENDLTAIYDSASRLLNEAFPADVVSARKAAMFARKRALILNKIGSESDQDRQMRALGDQGWYCLFSREYVEAVTSTRLAIEIATGKGTEPPDWISVNHAHSLMFAGNLAEASRIYLSKRNDPAWVKGIIGDFDKFERSGMRNVEMEAIRHKLTAPLT